MVRLAAVLGVLFANASCAHTPEGPGPATAAAVAATDGPGQIDRRIVEAAASASGVFMFKVATDAEGHIVKLAVYHKDADRVPGPVRQLAQERFPGSEVLFYELEVYAEGDLVHEVQVRTADGRECEVSAKDDGTLRYEECQMPAAELPQAARDAAARTVPGGEVLEAEERTGPDVDELRVEVRADDVLHYLRLSPSGELLGHQIRVPAELAIPAP